MKIGFTKAVATGNDFVIIDNRKGYLKKDLPGIARFLCDRRRGVGADGMMLFEKSISCDFRMRIFNLDGSEAEMCGNGSRCMALFAKENRIAPSKMRIQTLAGTVNAGVKGNMVKVRLTDPKDIHWNLCLMINECPYKVSFADTGVPHVVHFVKDIDKVGVKELGSKMRYHADFSPSGANVDFVKITDQRSSRIRVRTYERGVEDETLACGTGAVASAIISAEAESLKSPVTIETQGKEMLKVYFDRVDGHFRNVCLEGEAQLVFEGVIEYV